MSERVAEIIIISNLVDDSSTRPNKDLKFRLKMGTGLCTDPDAIIETPRKTKCYKVFDKIKPRPVTLLTKDELKDKIKVRESSFKSTRRSHLTNTDITNTNP